MFGKFHSAESKSLTSKPSELNPMFGRKHLRSSKILISNKISKPVTLFDVNNNYILTFNSNVQLSEYLGCDKSTVGKYIKSGKLYKGMYYIKKGLIS